MSRRTVSSSGILIALVGFGLTRFTVTLVVMDTPVQFLFASIVPLVLGLSLAAFGIVLTVGAYEARLVRTTAVWCLLGTVTMGILVVVTLLGSDPDALVEVEQLRQRTYLSNFLIGGAVGGTLTGLYAAQNRRQRVDRQQQANRLVILNRLLRDQVINAATAIKGHTDVLRESHSQQSVEIIDEQATNVIDTVENVKYLSETADKSKVSLGAIDLSSLLERELDRVQSAFPEAEYEYERVDEEIEVTANAQLGEVFRHLFENAIEYSDTDHPRLSVAVETSRKVARVRIVDNGPGLPEKQQALLERGEIAEFDDPTTGFGLNVVRLLVESFDGAIETRVTSEGTTVELELPRTGTPVATQQSRVLTAPGVTPSRIVLGVLAGLSAGVTMGATMAGTGFDLAVIGGLYGINDVFVALITHEFHSIVFALVYAAILDSGPLAYTCKLTHRLGIGVGLGLFLWVGAAGLVMPLWLRAVGVDIGLPNITLTSLLGHTAWGLTVSSVFHAGDGWLDQHSLFDGRSLLSPFDRP